METASRNFCSPGPARCHCASAWCDDRWCMLWGSLPVA